MAYIQWISPNLNARDYTGMCLRFSQRVFWNLNPYYYESATEAWNNTIHKSYERNIPLDVSVIVWFSHWGWYGDPVRFANWGHVVVWVPGIGYFSSPRGGTIESAEWFPTIEAVEAAFNCTFVGWSLDIGGVTVAWPQEDPAPKPVEEEKDPMPLRNYIPSFNPNKTVTDKWTTLLINDKQWVSVMNAQEVGSLGTIHVALHGDGDFEARFIYTTLDPSNDLKIVEESGSVIARYNSKGLHSWPFELKPKTATSEQRIRVQVRAVGKPVKITQLRAIVEYWRKK